MIPHLQDNQQYISFPPCPYGLTGDEANKAAPCIHPHGDGRGLRSERMLDVETLREHGAHAARRGIGVRFAWVQAEGVVEST